MKSIVRSHQGWLPCQSSGHSSNLKPGSSQSIEASIRIPCVVLVLPQPSNCCAPDWLSTFDLALRVLVICLLEILWFDTSKIKRVRHHGLSINRVWLFGYKWRRNNAMLDDAFSRGRVDIIPKSNWLTLWFCWFQWLSGHFHNRYSLKLTVPGKTE